MNELPYNRALHPSELAKPPLSVHRAAIEWLEGFFRSRHVPWRNDHLYRRWEYANVLRQLAELGCGPHVLDVGFGGSLLPALLTVHGYSVTANDSMAHGDCVPWLCLQCEAIGIAVPVSRESVEDLQKISNDRFDAVTCVSVLQHLDADQCVEALREMSRVCKLGGFVFVTTDYFENELQMDLSPFRDIQLTKFTSERIAKLLTTVHSLRMVGGCALQYRGDFVHNYSFVNLAFEVVK